MSILDRPTFYEGQILAAADLEALAANSRATVFRHERYRHTSGIVAGLELQIEDRTDADGNQYKDVTVAAGLAVDVAGRQVVVPEALPLDPGVFDQINGAGVDEEAWYPIFLLSEDTTQRAEESFGAEACGSAALPSRISETARIEYGRLGETAPTSAGAAAADVGAEPPARSERVLLGYVSWSVAAGRFADATTEPEGSPALDRAGAAGDEMAARSGRLELRTELARTAGTPTVRLEDTDGGRIAFGLINGSGAIDEVFSVDAAGNIDAKGRLSAGTLISGQTYVASGIASDGIIVPLPTGITQQQIDDGTVTVHTHLSPLLPPPSSDQVEVPVECELDRDRRVRCRLRRLDLSGIGASPPARPAACRYLIIVAVPPTEGS